MDRNNSGYTKIPNVMIDTMMQVMSPAAFKVAIAIARKTLGWNKRSDIVSVSQLEELTGMSRKTILSAIKQCVQNGWVEQEPVGNSFSYRLSESITKTESTEIRCSEDRFEAKKSVENGGANGGDLRIIGGETPLKSVEELHTQKKTNKLTKENNRDASNFQPNQEAGTQGYVEKLIYKHLKEEGLSLWHKVYARQTILSWLREGRFTANAIIYALAYSLEKGGSPGLVYNMLKIAPAKELPEFSDAYNIDTGNPLWKDYMWLSPEEEAAEKERLPDVW